MSLPCTNDPRVLGAVSPTLNVGPGVTWIAQYIIQEETMGNMKKK